MFRSLFTLLPLITLASSSSPYLTKRQSGSTINLTELIAELFAAPTAISRYELLGNDPGMTLDFLSQPSFGGGGLDGGVVLADDTIFPATIKNGGAFLMGFLGPCGMVAPHSHPRATELLLNLAGPPLNFGAIPEGGAPILTGTAGVGTVMMLPMNSMHFIQNSGCYPGVIGAFFNNESPGATFVSQAYAAFTEETVEAAFNLTGLEVLSAASIPIAVNVGRQQCLSACGLPSDYTFNATKSEIMLAAMAGYLQELGYQETRRKRSLPSTEA